MGYLHINNLYKEVDILLMKEVYCLEKIHGTSAHISYSVEGMKSDAGGVIKYFSGGVNYVEFFSLFDHQVLMEKFAEVYNDRPITIYGEAYGGKCQKMSDTYGKSLKFVVFDVKIGNCWLNVVEANIVAEVLGLEFVFYNKTNTDLETLNFERDRNSEQAVRNHMGIHPSEGIVIRPLIELTKNNGERLIAKYKKENFRETKTARPVNSEKLAILQQAEAVADEWVTEMRLNHIIDKLDVEIDTCNIPIIIRAMLEDIRRESEGEVEWSKDVERSIGKATAELVKSLCKQSLV